MPFLVEVAPINTCAGKGGFIMMDNLTVNSYAELFEDGNWMITSEDLPELLLAGEDINMLLRDLPKVIKIVLEKNYNFCNVTVRRASSPDFIKRQIPRAIVPEGQWSIGASSTVMA